MKRVKDEMRGYQVRTEIEKYTCIMLDVPRYTEQS